MEPGATGREQRLDVEERGRFGGRLDLDGLRRRTLFRAGEMRRAGRARMGRGEALATFEKNERTIGEVIELMAGGAELKSLLTGSEAAIAGG